jgi:hypothetical protein
LPLLADVRLEGVQLSGAKRLVLTREAESTARPIAWSAEGVAVGYAIDRPEDRVVVLSGLGEGSELPLRAAFPILIANALEWVTAKDTTSPSGSEAKRLGGEPFDAEPVEVKRLDAEAFAAATSCAVESDVRVPAGLASHAEMPAPGPHGPPVWLLLAAAALALVVTEWYLFQRRWTC